MDNSTTYYFNFGDTEIKMKLTFEQFQAIIPIVFDLIKENLLKQKDKK